MKHGIIFFFCSLLSAALFSLFPLQPSGFLEIPYGLTGRKIGGLLYRMRWLNFPLAWEISLKILQKEKGVQSGIYELPVGMSVWELTKYLNKPESRLLIEVTFPEGIIAEEIAKILEEHHLTRAEDFLAEVSRPEKYYDLLPWAKDSPLPTLEGFLFPDTYTFSPMMPPESIIRTFLRRFLQVLPEDAEQQAKNLERTIPELLTIASLIERETLWDSEKPLVSSVIHNRLRKGMHLQIDATVSYALKKWKALTREDLQATHPYNTYINLGLPPGAIGNPGKASIDAAFHPANTSYLYFTLWEHGYHRFSSTYEEHLRWRALSPALRQWYGQETQPTQ